MKKCTKCGVEKPATTEFFCKSRGQLRSYCKECQRRADRLRALTEARKTNRKIRRQANPEKARECVRRWRKKNRERKAAYDKAWRERNPTYTAKSQRRRYHENPNFRLKNVISRRMRIQIRKGSKNDRWENLMGYSIAELKSHIERQFSGRMTWSNYGTAWVIDHIIPASSFKIVDAGDEEFRACWALTNLRPLWKKQNRAKWHHRTHLL